MTSPKQTFESLCGELRREVNLKAENRSREFEVLTLDYFLEHGRKTEDHDLWRDCHMLEEMIAIMDRKFLARNPQIENRLRLKRRLEELAPDQESEQMRILHEYTDEVDEDGRTQQEIDGKKKAEYPDIDRRTLELQAAENYLHTRWGIKRKRADNTSPRKVARQKESSENTNPILSYKELQRELQKSFHTHGAVKEAVTRAISDGREIGDPPWPMGGCAKGYRITTAESKKGFDHPTPSACKFQKILQESED